MSLDENAFRRLTLDVRKLLQTAAGGNAERLATLRDKQRGQCLTCATAMSLDGAVARPSADGIELVCRACHDRARVPRRPRASTPSPDAPAIVESSAPSTTTAKHHARPEGKIDTGKWREDRLLQMRKSLDERKAR